MRNKILDVLRCPNCKGMLKLEIYSEEKQNINSEIIDGLLSCICGEWYPVINGIPRMLPFELKHILRQNHSDYFKKYRYKLPHQAIESQRQCPEKRGSRFRRTRIFDINIKKDTMERFGYEWNKFPDYRADNFLRFISPLSLPFFSKKIGLDAGCGAGRHLQQLSRYATEIFGIDLSESVEAAYKNTKGLSNVHIVQGDIEHLPFEENWFDFIYSLGVLHHLSHPQLGFKNLLLLLKPEGTILIWVYARTKQKIILEPIRRITSKLPDKLRYYLALICALIDYNFLIKLYRMGNKISKIRPWLNFIVLPHIREYAKYNFKVNLTDWFDRISAPISCFYRKEEIEDWFKQTVLRDVEISYLEGFWRGFGRKD